MEKSLNHAALYLTYLQINGISFDGKICLPAPGFNMINNPVFSGLLKEKISQGAKTRLRKLSNSIESHLKAFEETKANAGEESVPDEDFLFSFDPISIDVSKVEEIVSDHDYSHTIEIFFE